MSISIFLSQDPVTLQMRGLSMGVNHHDVPLLTEKRELPNSTLLLLYARLLQAKWLGIVARNQSIGCLSQERLRCLVTMQQV